MYRAGGSIVGFRLSMLRENIRLTVQRKCHVLSEQTVQNLKSSLFFLSKRRILHDVNLTFLLAKPKPR